VPERQNMNYHVVSKKWFLRWQLYTQCAVDEKNMTLQQEAESKPPGPINTNSEIKGFIDTESVDRIDLSSEFITDIHLKRTAREDKDYIVVA
jgi:hypothetical protein